MEASPRRHLRRRSQRNLSSLDPRCSRIIPVSLREGSDIRVVAPWSLLRARTALAVCRDGVLAAVTCCVRWASTRSVRGRAMHRGPCRSGSRCGRSPTPQALRPPRTASDDVRGVERVGEGEGDALEGSRVEICGSGGRVDAEDRAAQGVVPDRESFPADRGQDEQSRRSAAVLALADREELVRRRGVGAGEIGAAGPGRSGTTGEDRGDVQLGAASERQPVRGRSCPSAACRRLAAGVDRGEGAGEGGGVGGHGSITHDVPGPLHPRPTPLCLR